MTHSKEKPVASFVCLPVLAVFVVLFYYQWLSGSFYVWEDLLHWYYPSANYFCTSLAKGRFPLWLPGVFDGVPYYTDIESSVFYPPLWLMVPFAHGQTLSWLVYQWYMVLHIFLGVLFMFLYLRNRRLNSWSCLLGTSIFCFSGFASLHIIHFPMLQVYAWLPLQLLLVDKAVETGCARFYAWLTVVILLSFLAGFPQTTFYDSLLVVAYWIYTRYRRSAASADNDSPPGLREVGREGLRIAGVYVSVLLLAAFMALPTLEHWRLSVRHDIKFEGMAIQSMPPYYLVALAVPKFFGCFNDLLIGERFWGADPSQQDVTIAKAPGYWQYWEFGAYAGQISLLAILVFLYHRKETRNTPVRFFLVAAGLAIWFMLGRHGGLYTVLYYALPGVSMFRGPSRMSGVFDFAAAVLAAYLLESALARQIPRLGKALRTGLVLIVAGTFVFLIFGRMLFPLMRVGSRASFATKHIEISIVLAGSLAICIYAIQFLRAPWVRQLACGTVVLFTFNDLFHAHNLFYRGMTNPDEYFAKSMGIIQDYEHAVRNLGPMRFTQMMSGQYAEILLDADTPLMEPGLETHRGYLNFQPHGVAMLAGITNIHTRLDLQNVAFVARVFPNSRSMKWEIRTNALPRLAFYTDIRRYQTEQDISDDLQDGKLDYHKTVPVLDRELGGCLNTATPTNEVQPFCLTIRSISPEYYVVNYTVKTPGLLVVNETYFPGWEVTDQHGTPCTVIHAFLAFKGVVIPRAGVGQLTFRFRPRSLRTGGAISAVSLLLLGFVYTALIRRERRGSSPPAPSAPPEQRIVEPQSV
ncbi:MAG TPA: hypothetical protein VMP11_13260 [Verrucomicrobiae bacterium]|nr:hypothetical protein [Verrucomicrobiae bacterium]